MARLHCPAGHEWDWPAQPTPDDPPTRGECPVCGQPVAVDCPVYPAFFTRGCLVLLGLFILAPAVFVIGTNVLEAKGVLQKNAHESLPYIFAGAMTPVVLVYFLVSQRKRRAGIAVAAEALGLRFRPQPGPGLREMLQGFPLFRGSGFAGNCKNVLTGAYHGCSVAVFDFTGRLPNPWGKPVNGTTTAVAYLDLEPGLPDFELEPTRERSKFYNKDLLVLLGLRQPPPGVDRQFGQRYRLTAADQAATEHRFTDKVREVLAGLKGWGIQSHDGRLLFFRVPGAVCPPNLYGTLLAVTWRLCQVLAA